MMPTWRTHEIYFSLSASSNYLSLTATPYAAQTEQYPAMFVVRQSHKAERKAIATSVSISHYNICPSMASLPVPAKLVTIVINPLFVSSSLGLMMAILLLPKHVALSSINIC
jgi:hypothetical protein